MSSVGNGKKADLYLSVIGVLLLIIMGVMTWSFQAATARNDRDHDRIIGMVQSLANEYRDFTEHAPPDHVHLPDGSCARKMPIH